MLIFFVFLIATAAAVPRQGRKIENEEALEVDDGILNQFLEKIAPQHRDAFVDLLRCVVNSSAVPIELDRELVSFLKPGVPIFLFVIPTPGLDQQQAKCFTESKDKFIVALLNLVNAIGGHYGPHFRRPKIFKLLLAYTDLCHKDHKFALPCKNDLDFLSDEQSPGKINVRKAVERHYRAAELVGALSYVGADLIQGELCKFDLEGRLNPKVFTADFDPREPVIETCKAASFENIIFLANGAFL